MLQCCYTAPILTSLVNKWDDIVSGKGLIVPLVYTLHAVIKASLLFLFFDYHWTVYRDICLL